MIKAMKKRAAGKYLGRSEAIVKAKDYGIHCGEFQTGPLNKITDVCGVTVGHYTMHVGKHNTGITVILPVPEDGTKSLFLEKCIAACYVQNGFGKTTGLMQVDELGTLETPIVLTNTLNVGKLSDALITHVLRYEKTVNPDKDIFSINPVVGECNDSHLNDIRERVLGEEELEEAFLNAGKDFQEGAVGAGTGTICYGLKGGIGSASRLVTIDGKVYTLGILVQSNFGRTKNLIVGGKPIGRTIMEALKRENDEGGEAGGIPSAMEALDKERDERSKKDVTSKTNGITSVDRGSIMMIFATDMPLTARQLRRILRRVPNGLARTGSYTGNGSGEVVIGFTTANRIREIPPMLTLHAYPDHMLDPVFRAVTELSEEAVLNSMLKSQPAEALDGTKIHSLAEFVIDTEG